MHLSLSLIGLSNYEPLKKSIIFLFVSSKAFAYHMYISGFQTNTVQFVDGLALFSCTYHTRIKMSLKINIGLYEKLVDFKVTFIESQVNEWINFL